MIFPAFVGRTVNKGYALKTPSHNIHLQSEFESDTFKKLRNRKSSNFSRSIHLNMEKQYKYLGYIFMLFIPLIFFGFYKTYFVLAPEFMGSVDIYTHIHAGIASLWIVLLITQPLLILYKNNQLHRTLGKASYIIFPALILSFIPQIMKEISRGDIPFHASFDIVLLILFYTFAIRNKHNIADHMRYLIAISLIFIGSTLGRIMYITLDLGYMSFLKLPFILVHVILVGLIVWDKIGHRKYQAYFVALAAFMVYLVALYLR